MTIDWQHIYLLGWYGFDPQTGKIKSYLTSWAGTLPVVPVLVKGTDIPPMWNAIVPDGATIEAIPERTDPHAYAKKHQGIYAFGWYVNEGFIRGAPKTVLTP